MYKHASINRVYKLVWNPLRCMWVPVPEHQSACSGKKAKRKQQAVLSSLSLVLAVVLSPGMSNAEPTGGVVTTGSALISRTGTAVATVTNIKQNNTGLLGLEWSTFNIGRNETVNFIQPSEASVAFNRILDSQGSQILGKINAIGHVWLVNPNGLFFGKDAQVNVGGLVASALNTATPQGFGIFSQRLNGNSLASVENQGLINAGFTNPAWTGPKAGGFVGLIGHSVKNSGGISTGEGGTVALAAGSDVNLQFAGNSLISVSVNQNQWNAMAVNGGLMQADGGKVILTAGAANSALASVVNNTGVMQAKSSAMFGGRIVLSSAAKDGQLNLSGELNAAGLNGADGGNITTQASVIRVSGGTVVDTSSAAGSWGKWSLVQKNTAQSTSDANLSSMISGSTLGSALNHSNVSLFTDKDLRIDTTLAWNAPSRLSLVTQRNIAIDAPINAEHATGSMSLAYGQASTDGVVDGVKSSYAVKAPVGLREGNNFTTQQGSAGAVKNFYVITRLGNEGSVSGKDLQGMNGNKSGNFALGSDIDASATTNWNNGLGFAPIGKQNANFQGVFEGLGHSITGLKINRAMDYRSALFGSVQNALIRNINLKEINIAGKGSVGGLVGLGQNSVIENSHTAGEVKGEIDVGGLVGYFLNGNIVDSSSTARVTQLFPNTGINMGGLVGTFKNGEIKNSFSNGQISGNNSVGGLIGRGTDAAVVNSYALTRMSSQDEGAIYFGGLMGSALRASINNSFANVSMNGSTIEYGGGLIGSGSYLQINNSYASGDLNVIDSGGLIGIGSNVAVKNSFSNISNTSTYSAGIASGLSGNNSFINTYWNSSTTADAALNIMPGSVAVVQNSNGLTAQQMLHADNFSGFDFSSTWTVYEGKTSPLIQSFMSPLTVKITATQGQIYSADIAYKGNASIVDQDNVLSKLQGAPNYVLTSKNAGVQAVTDNGLYSNQLGYLISYDTSGSQIQIDKAAVTVSGITADNKVYDGKKAAVMNLSQMQTSGIYAADQASVSINIQGTFDSKDVGDNKQVTIAGATGGANGGNYFIAGQTSATANVTPATYTALNGSKTYDATDKFTNVTLTGVNGETFTVAKAAANGVNVSTHPQNAGTTFVQAEGISELAGGLGKTSNYKPLDITQLTNNQAVIAPANFQAIAGTKTYDGSTTFQQAIVTGVNNELFTVTADANSKNTSNNAIIPAKTFTSVDGVLVPIQGSGADLRNYNGFNLASVNTNQAVITPKPLLLNGVTASDKVYDGTRIAVLDTSQGLTSTSGVVAGDEVSVKNVIGQFTDKNAGQDKRVDLSQIEFNGASKDNYMPATQQFTTATIHQAEFKEVTGSKTYDGSTEVRNIQVTGVNGEIFEADGKANSKNASRSLVDAGNVLVQINQVQSPLFDVKNYKPLDIHRLEKNVVTIDPAILTYVADPKIVAYGQDITDLSGTVMGFMPDDSLEQSTTGDLSWVTPATTESPEGVYEITGQGLTADNYDFVQHQDNAVALTVTSPFNTVITTQRPVSTSDSEDDSGNDNLGNNTQVSVTTPITPEPEESTDNNTQVSVTRPITPEPEESTDNNTQVSVTTPITPEPEESTDNNTQVSVTTPITPEPEQNTVVQNLPPSNNGSKTPPNTSDSPTPLRVDTTTNNNRDNKTDRPVAIPTINDLQAIQINKINSWPSADAVAVNTATRLSSLEDDYWFMDCLFTSAQQVKKIRCEPVQQKKSPSIEIKKYPNKKLSALNSPLLP